MVISSIKKIRIKKVEALRKAGMNPYPIKTDRTHTIAEIILNFERYSEMKEGIFIAGRIMSIREHGGSTFMHFEDGTGRLQAFLKRDKLGDENYKIFVANLDVGDFIEIGGTLFMTKRGEKTIEASSFKVLAKSLLPLPEKWHGLTDIEERFRKRYLDLVMNAEVKKNFETRSRILKELRDILDKRQFIEVETPILQPIPGGAFAKPFKTHLNALKMDLFLRVSPELYLKRLLVGGFEKIFEIGRSFRNEGMDKHHNPDFTLFELYWAYQNRDGLMKFTEEFMTELIKKVKNGTKISYQGQEIDFQIPWEKITFRDLVKKYAEVDIEEITDHNLKKKVMDLGIKLPKESQREELLDELYKKTCRPNITQPTFVLDYPIEMAVLAKTKEKDPRYADRFQLIVAGVELINGFSEQNDPQEQKMRFKKSKISLERRDEDFLEALEYGMPPAAGLGMGIDRLIVLLTDSYSLREVILFPTMRSKN